jgi:hypothetical protein
MTYPKPDRSSYTPARTKAEGDGMLDIALDEDLLRDGRPFRAEWWIEDGVMSVNFFFSSIGLELLDQLDHDRSCTLRNHLHSSASSCA